MTDYGGMKYVSLCSLIVQASCSALIMRFSRTMPGPPYIVATAVFMTELLKFVVCSVLVALEELPKGKPTGVAVQEKVVAIVKGSPPYAIPAFLYVVQQSLLIVGASYLDAVSYQICNQMKVVPTALFSVWLLSRTLSMQQWLSLPVMAVGVAIVTAANSGGESLVEQENSMHEYMLGLAACMAASFSSGFASVYFEKHVKGGSTTSLWVKNIQLGIYGLCISGSSLLGSKQTIQEHGMFYGFTWATWGVVVMQALGGLLVALVVKYADNILKGFANAISVIMSWLLSIPIFGLFPKPIFGLGLVLVIGSIFMYNHALKAPLSLIMGDGSSGSARAPARKRVVIVVALLLGVVVALAGGWYVLKGGAGAEGGAVGLPEAGVAAPAGREDRAPGGGAEEIAAGADMAEGEGQGSRGTHHHGHGRRSIGARTLLLSREW